MSTPYKKRQFFKNTESKQWTQADDANASGRERTLHSVWLYATDKKYIQ